MCNAMQPSMTRADSKLHVVYDGAGSKPARDVYRAAAGGRADKGTNAERGASRKAVVREDYAGRV